MTLIPRTQSILTNDRDACALASSFLDSSSFNTYRQLCRDTHRISWGVCVDRVSVLGRMLTSHYILEKSEVGALCLKKITREGFQEAVFLAATTPENGRKAAYAVVKVAVHLWQTDPDPEKKQLKELFERLQLPGKLFAAVVSKISNGREEDLRKLLDQFSKHLNEYLTEWPENLPDPKCYAEQLGACFAPSRETLSIPRGLIDEINKLAEELLQEERNELEDLNEGEEKLIGLVVQQKCRDYLMFSGAQPPKLSETGRGYIIHNWNTDYNVQNRERAVRAARLKQRISNHLQGQLEFALEPAIRFRREFEGCVSSLVQQNVRNEFFATNEGHWRFPCEGSSLGARIDKNNSYEFLSSLRVPVVAARTEIARQKFWEGSLLQAYQKESVAILIQMPNIAYINPQEAGIIVNAVSAVRERGFQIHRILIDGGQFSDASFERLKGACQQPGQTIRVYSYPRSFLSLVFKLDAFLTQLLIRAEKYGGVRFYGTIIGTGVSALIFLFAFSSSLIVAQIGMLPFATLCLALAALGYAVYPHIIKRVWAHTYIAR